MEIETQMIALVVAMSGAMIYGFKTMVSRLCDITKIIADMQSMGERIARLEANYEQIDKKLERILDYIDGSNIEHVQVQAQIHGGLNVD